VRTPDLVLYFRGRELPRDLVTTVEALAPSRLEGWTLERLAEQVAKDPELGQARLPMPPGVDEGERPRSLLDTWGDGSAWADFFAGGELARSQLDSLDPSTLFSFVQHSDSECIHVNPHCAAPIVWFVSYPWEDRRGEQRAAQAGRQVESLATAELVTTELDENDVILGNPDKLDRALAYAVKAQARHGKTIFFSNTCVPVVTGEDVESRVDKVRASCGCPMLFLTVTPRSMVNVFQEILVDRRLAAEAATGPPAPGTVNLVGFARRRDLGELTGLLSACGVSVGCVLLPDLDPGLVDRLPSAGLNVLRPNNLWQNLYDQVMYSSRTPAITPQAPYGVQGTRRWLTEVARAAGSGVDADRVWQEAFAPRQEAWETLRGRIRGHRVALVVRGEETYHLTRPASTWGIPLVEVLEELGFGLDVLLHVGSRAAAHKAATEVQGVLTDPGRHMIKGFNSFELLRRRLAESAAEAVVTSHTFDWRVTGSGKVPVSLQVFEMGLEGALRTGARLLEACRTPFYRRYARHLGRTRSGLRPAPVAEEAP
ncbi:MAG: hypothetical protein FJ098_05950, partial [Deltaproteobacteria bacterium]|nr:hypothetical protein [Deltaproteobacteria bacterium]